MSRTVETFDSRLRRVNRRHTKMTLNGARARVGRDGLITAVPRRRGPKFPLRGVAILFMAALLYKSVLFAWLGDQVYNSRLAELQNGTLIEQAGAWILQPDTATVTAAAFIGPFLPNP